MKSIWLKIDEIQEYVNSASTYTNQKANRPFAILLQGNVDVDRAVHQGQGPYDIFIIFQCYNME